MYPKRVLLAIGVVLLLVVVVIGGWTFYDAWDAGLLPWQPEPTRVAVTPFADLPTPSVTPAD